MLFRSTKTASLKATIADVRNLDAEKIKIKGQNISDLWGLKFPEDYPKLVTRCQLPEDENWSLWDDNGNLVYINFSDKIINGTNIFQYCDKLTTFSSDLSSLIDGTNMFYNCSNLTSFTSDLSSLSNGIMMFIGCPKLTSFTSDLSSLTNGNGMFDNCKLDSNSIENILTTIPTTTTTKTLSIGIQESATSKFAEITGLTPTTTQQTVSYKGWSVKVKINK